MSKKRIQRPSVRFCDLPGKETYFIKHKRYTTRKRWYRCKYPDFVFKVKLNLLIRFLTSISISIKLVDFLRWILVDFLRGKGQKHWGIYCYVANPGQGKTLSMVAHIERSIKELKRENLYIATNFFYQHQDSQIIHWIDMIKAAKFALDHGKYCIIAMDEIHITFDASDWKSFPPEMLSLLSFNRKYDLQFLCSSQRYDRIPKKVVGISNYVVLCKNLFDMDRYFLNYYYPTADYEAGFDGKRSHSSFIRSYVAGDSLYHLYDTKKQVDNMVLKAEDEKNKRQEAFSLLFDGETADEQTG